MSHISEIFERANIQYIREYLLRGVPNTDINPMNYKERLAKAQKAAIELIEEKFPDMAEHEEITNRVYDYAGACEDIYMEIGLQCGFLLAMQIFHNVQAK